MPKSLLKLPPKSLVIDIAATQLSDQEAKLIQNPLVGGLIFFARNYETPAQLAVLVRQIRAVRPDLLLCVDQEGGRVQRFKTGMMRIPSMQAVVKAVKSTTSKDLEAQSLMESVAWLLAAELLSLGVDLSFTPVLDLDYGHNEVIGDRAFGQTLNEVVHYAKPFIQGLNMAGMVATGKHFPGHGYVDQDSHLVLPTDPRKKPAVYEDMQAFVRLLPQLAGVMVAHVAYPCIDEVPAGFSKAWLTHVLRNELHYLGVIMSDDLCMGAALAEGDIVERARAALAAGCDLLLVCNQPDQAKALIQNAEVNREYGAVAERLLSGNAFAIDHLRARPNLKLPQFEQLAHWAPYQAHFAKVSPLFDLALASE